MRFDFFADGGQGGLKVCKFPNKFIGQRAVGCKFFD